MHNLLTNDSSLCTEAEQEAADALRTARPHLFALHAQAATRAQTAHLEKIRSALSREGFSDSMPPTLPDHPVRLVEAVMGARAGSRGPEHWNRLRDEVAASVATHGLALVAEADRRTRVAGPAGTGNALEWAQRRAAADPGFSPLAVFEQSVVDGHPWHPCARLRGGMTFDDVLAYTPEWADEIALGLLAVETGVDDGLTAALRRWYPALTAPADAWLAAHAPRGGPYTLLPVHPWQLRHAVPQRYGAALADGRIAVVPSTGEVVRPLLSVRTLASAKDRLAPHLKTALNVQLTSAVRIVSPAAVGNGPRLSALVREIADREKGFAGRFVVLAELAAGSYRPSSDESSELASGLGAIARESPERYAETDEIALPAAALTARSPLRDRPLLIDALSRIGGPPAHAAHRFLAAYCDCAFPPLFALLSRYGVALEAHGQNTVVILRDGLPVRLAYRDLGGIRVSPVRLARKGFDTPALAGTLVTDNEAELRGKLFGSLVTTKLAALVPELARLAGVPATDLWRLVARRCRSAYRPLLDDPAVCEQALRDLAALLGPTLPAKALLRMRLADDPLAEQWIDAPNPLAEAA